MAVIPAWQGRFFEDFTVGDVYRSRLGRTVTVPDHRGGVERLMTLSPGRVEVVELLAAP
jgi:hypothetical protein